MPDSDKKELLKITSQRRLRDLSLGLNTIQGIRSYLKELKCVLNAFSQEHLETESISEFIELGNVKKQELSGITESLLKLVKSTEYMELVRIGFFGKPNVKMAAIVKDYPIIVREYLNPTGDKAFLDVTDKEFLQTERKMDGSYKQGMTLRQGISLLENMENGTLKHGQKYGKYTIMGVYPNDVKISCGMYSKELLFNLFKEVKKNQS